MSLLRKFRCLMGAHYWLRGVGVGRDARPVLKCFYCPATQETR